MPSTDADPYENDESIADGDVLYRRVGPDYWDANRLDAHGHPEIRRNAFQPWPEDRAMEEGLPGTAMSVALLSELDRLSCPVEEVLSGFPPEYGLARIEVGAVRSIDGLGVVRWRTDAEPWHAMVFSTTNPKFTNGQKKALKRTASWVLLPQFIG